MHLCVSDLLMLYAFLNVASALAVFGFSILNLLPHFLLEFTLSISIAPFKFQTSFRAIHLKTLKKGLHILLHMDI